MAQESCNLDNDEAEVLKPSSPPPSNPSPSQPTTPTAISNSSSSLPQPPSASLCIKPLQEVSAQKPKSPEESCKLKAEKESQLSVQFGNRCSSCKKRVGLTGFRCRCGALFCVKHRHSDTHDCSFDYKALGREEIAKANPLIRAAKIIKI